MAYENGITTRIGEKLLQKISKRERILITSGKHQYLSFSLIIFYILISISTVSYLLYSQGINWKVLLSAVAFVLIFHPVFKLCRKMADIAIKGDILLINQIFSPCKVTSIKSVRAVKTWSFLKLSVTSLTYNLDGNRGKIILLKRLKSHGNKPEEIIKFIRNVA